MIYVLWKYRPRVSELRRRRYRWIKRRRRVVQLVERSQSNRKLGLVEDKQLILTALLKEYVLALVFSVLAFHCSYFYFNFFCDEWVSIFDGYFCVVSDLFCFVGSEILDVSSYGERELQREWSLCRSWYLMPIR